MLNLLRMKMLTFVVDPVPCMGESFACTRHHPNQPQRCLRPQFVCDGHNDCKDSSNGTDEDFCGRYIFVVFLNNGQY